MKVVHSITVCGKCPHGCPDVYAVEVHTSRLIRVEEIEAAIDKILFSPVYQEDFTRSLSLALQCKVVTRGQHGRFSTLCEVSSE